MRRTDGTGTWWTADEIAAATLPDMPTTKRRVNALANREGWRSDPKHARRRKGRGGGWEYHAGLFPLAARRKLMADAGQGGTDARLPAVVEQMPRGEAWAWFDSLPDVDKTKANDRLKVIQMVEALVAQGLTKNLAVTEVAQMVQPSARSIWNWFKLIEGIAIEDRLAYLAPRYHAAAEADSHEKGIGSPDWWEVLKADFLRKEARVPFSSAYRRSVRIAKANGWGYLPERTARRRLDELVPRVVQVFAREGVAGLERCFSPQVRDRTQMVAMEAVNADTHRIDVFVEWEDGTIDRPQIVAFQDLYSGKMLSWRVDHTPNRVSVMAAFGEMVHEYGIPRRCLFDNGREFANKWLTGGTPTRYRFKVRDDDPLGVLPQLGIEVNWARPYSGRSKPIERAFRDWSLDIALDPRFAGAYTGNLPTAKPENYRERAVPIAEFLQVLEEGIAEHNARPGRRSPTTMGRSFDETFDESYASAPIRKATEEQRRLWLMGQEVKKLHSGNGRFTLYKNVYWSDWMAEIAGRKVAVRFDPEDLHVGAYVYGLDGVFLGFAACQQAVGFFDATHGQEEARRVAAFKRQHKRMLDAHRSLKPADVAAHLNAIPREATAAPAAKVVRPEFGAGRGTGPLVKRPLPKPSDDAASEAQNAALVAEFKVREQAEAPAETEYDRFRRALDLEERSADGTPLGEAEARWLETYQVQPEYRAMMRLYDDFGEQLFAK